MQHDQHPIMLLLLSDMCNSEQLMYVMPEYYSDCRMHRKHAYFHAQESQMQLYKIKTISLLPLVHSTCIIFNQ